MGSIDIGTVTTNSVAYTVKYIDKNKRIPIHRNDDRVKEYSVMSKGLGKSWMTDEVKKHYRKDPTRNYITNGKFKIAMPRYYADKIWNEDQKKVQKKHVKKMVEAKEKAERMEVKILYGKNVDVDRVIEGRKQARYNSFYKNQKIRDEKK